MRRFIVVAMLCALSTCSTAPAFAGYGPRPHAWCGWWMRQQVPRDPGPAFNLARKWLDYGPRQAEPCVNCIAVRPHHVGLVTGLCGPGCIILKSGNDGRAVRERPRSVRGFKFVRQ
jgi:hypothetical protein